MSDGAGRERGMLALVLLGLAMVVCGTVALTWPADVPGENVARLVRHWDRLASAGGAAPSMVWTLRRVMDGVHYGLLFSGLALAGWAMARRRRSPWIGLLVVGAVGVIYAAPLVLYMGAMVSAPGYLIVFLSAALTLLAWQSAGGGLESSLDMPAETL